MVKRGSIMTSKEEICSYAYKYSKFYIDQNIGEIEKWENIPFLKKEDILDNIEEFISYEYWQLYNQKRLLVKNTSGSTGKHLKIYWDEKDYKKSMLSLWYYRYKYYGIKPLHKVVYFFTWRAFGDSGEDLKEVEEERSLGFSKDNLEDKRIIER